MLLYELTYSIQSSKVSNPVERDLSGTDWHPINLSYINYLVRCSGTTGVGPDGMVQAFPAVGLLD